MIGGLAIWAGAKAVGSGLLTFAKRIPWQVWVAIVLLIAVWQGWAGVNRALNEREKRGDRTGYARATAEFVAKAQKIKASADLIAADARRLNDEAAHRTHAAADALRVRGPGQARCTATVRPRASSGPNPTSGSADAPSVGLPEQDRGAVPWDWLVGQAKVCDLNRSEVLSWREWHRQLIKVPGSG